MCRLWGRSTDVCAGKIYCYCNSGLHSGTPAGQSQLDFFVHQNFVVVFLMQRRILICMSLVESRGCRWAERVHVYLVVWTALNMSSPGVIAVRQEVGWLLWVSCLTVAQLSRTRKWAAVGEQEEALTHPTDVHDVASSRWRRSGPRQPSLVSPSVSCQI